MKRAGLFLAGCAIVGLLQHYPAATVPKCDLSAYSGGMAVYAGPVQS